MEQTAYCHNPKCRKPIEQTPHKRAKLYCSDACRKEGQRTRERGAQMYREELAGKKLAEVWTSLPESIVTRLQHIQRIYGVWAAYEATQAVMEYQTMTDQQVHPEFTLTVEAETFARVQDLVARLPFPARATATATNNRYHIGGLTSQEQVAQVKQRVQRYYQDVDLIQ